MPYTVPFASPDTRTIADLIMRSADARAQGLQRAGEISGQMYANLGNTAANTIGALVKYKQDEPIRAQESKLRDLQIQEAEGRQAQTQRMTDAQKVVDALPYYASGEGRQALLESLDGPARELAMQHYQQADEAKAKLDMMTAQTQAARDNSAESQTKIQAAQLDVFGALAAGVKAHNYDTGAFYAAVADAVGKGLIPLDQAGQMVAHGIQNPEWVKQATDELIARSPAQQQLMLQREQEQRMTAAAQASAANAAADNRRADATAAEAARHNRAMENRPVAGGPGNQMQWATDPKTGDTRLMTNEEIRTLGARQAPTADMRNKVAGRDLVGRSIGAIEQMSQRIISKVGPAQRADAIRRGADAVFGKDPEFRTYQDARMALAGNLAVAQQGSRPSDADIKAIWLPLVPDAYRDTSESAAMKWNLIRTMSNTPPSEGGGLDTNAAAPPPGAPAVGSSVTLKNGQTVVIKAIHPDGTFDY